MSATHTNDNALNLDTLSQKLLDADSCGFLAECSPTEAEAMGAFAEDALDMDDAVAGGVDWSALTRE